LPSTIQQWGQSSPTTCDRASAEPSKPARIVEQQTVLIDLELDGNVVVRECPPVGVETEVTMCGRPHGECLDIDCDDG